MKSGSNFRCGRLVYGKLHFQDAAAVHRQNFKFIMMIKYFLMQRGKLPFDLKQQSGQRIGITVHLLKIVLIYLSNLVEVCQLGLCFKTQV